MNYPKLALLCLLVIAAIPLQAGDIGPLLGYWNSNGRANVVKIHRDSTLAAVGRLIEVTDAAERLGYRENDIVIKQASLEQAKVNFKTAIRPKDPKHSAACGVHYLQFDGLLNQAGTEITGKRAGGKFELVKNAAGKITGCRFLATSDRVAISYVRNTRYQPDIKIVTLNQPGSLAIGELFLVQIELQEETAEKTIRSELNIGSQNLTVTAKRVSEFPAVFESDLIEVTWQEKKSTWPDIKASYQNHDQRVKIDGWTADAQLHLLQRLLRKSPDYKDKFASLQNAERIFEVASAGDNQAIERFAGLGLIAIARHTALPPAYTTMGEELLGEFKRRANKKLRSHLDGIHPQVEVEDKNLRRGLVLLKEAALLNGLQKLYEINRYKPGKGLLPVGSFIGLSSAAAVKKMRGMKVTELNRFLDSRGVANNQAARKKLRDSLLDRSRSVYKPLADAAFRIKYSGNALSLHGLADLVDVSNYDNDRLPTSLRIIRNNILKYERLISRYPLLGVKVKDQASATGSMQPLWRVLGRPHNPLSDRQVEAYVDRALGNSEAALKKMLHKVVAMKTTKSLIELGSPRYKRLQDMAQANFGADQAKSLIDLVKGKYREVNADDYFWELFWDDLLTAVQVFGSLVPPVAVGATAVKIAIKSGQTVAAYETIGDAEMTGDAGFGSHEALLQAQDQFHSRVGSLSFEAIFGVFDITAAIKYKAFKTLQARLAAASANASADTVKSAIKSGSKQVEQELALYQRFYDDVQNRKRLTGNHQRYADQTREKIKQIQKKVSSAQLAGDTEKLLREQAKLSKKAGTLRYHLARLKRSKQKLAKMLNKGPKLPAQGKQPNYMKQGQDIERAATLRFFEAMQFRHPDVVKRSADGAFHFAKMEFRFKGRILGPNQQPLVQKPTVTLFEEVNGQLVAKQTLVNPHAGKTMEFDRIIIDHNSKTIFLEDIVRSPNKRHMLKTWGYFDALKTMFKKELTEDGYKLALPRDVHFGQMKNPFNAITPNGAKYKVVEGKSYLN